jgi:lysine-N-methylase
LRPRLADHALARRHVAAGEELVIVHDTRLGRLVRIGPREWGLVACADGTRDLEGILLAAARAGTHARLPALRAFLEDLHAAGLIEDGTGAAPVAAPSAIAADRPLDPLADFSLVCDGGGSCCRIYASVVFLPIDVARARALLPLVREGGLRPDLAFCPEHGSAPGGASAAALIDGCCAYLDGNRRCSLHASAGPPAKPLGCRSFPATFTDDGECIRISVAVECACVLASLHQRGGIPLVRPESRTRADLEEGIFISELPARLPLTASSDGPRSDLAGWSRAVCQSPPASDVPSAFCALSAAVQSDGLDLAAAGRAIAGPRSSRPADLASLFDALAARAARRAAEDAEWRSPGDLARQATCWIARAAAALREPDTISMCWNTPPADPAAEAFYLRASIHGHHLAGDLPLCVALRDRAARILLARALADVIPADITDPAAEQPLALVEAMLRGHGLASYAHDAL